MASRRAARDARPKLGNRATKAMTIGNVFLNDLSVFSKTFEAQQPSRRYDDIKRRRPSARRVHSTQHRCWKAIKAPVEPAEATACTSREPNNRLQYAQRVPLLLLLLGHGIYDGLTYPA